MLIKHFIIFCLLTLVFLSGCVENLTPEEVVQKLSLDWAKGDFASIELYSDSEIKSAFLKCKETPNASSQCTPKRLKLVIDHKIFQNETEAVFWVNSSVDSGYGLHDYPTIFYLKVNDSVWKLYRVESKASPIAEGSNFVYSKYLFDPKYCETDSDCVPVASCHPRDVINRYQIQTYKDETCTLLCSGPLECGCGIPECYETKCIIKHLLNESWCS